MKFKVTIEVDVKDTTVDSWTGGPWTQEGSEQYFEDMIEGENEFQEGAVKFTILKGGE